MLNASRKRVIPFRISILYKQNKIPGENRGHEPGQEADEGCPRLRADVSGFEWFANSVVPFEADGQDSQDRSMGHCQLDEWYG